MSDGPVAAQREGRGIPRARVSSRSGLRRALCPVFALALAGCAAVTPAPKFSAQSPADPAGPEAATGPATPALMTAAEEGARGPKEPAPTMMEMDPNMKMEPGEGQDMDPHKGHVMTPSLPSSTPSSSAPAYTCLMHPEVMKDKPGACPICGMPLVKKSPKREEPHP